MSLDQHNTVSLRHAHAPGIELPAPQPKPTSISGQLEATVNLWERWLPPEATGGAADHLSQSPRPEQGQAPD